MLKLFIDYNKWHYTHALSNIFTLTKEFIRFFLNLFSVRLFSKSLFGTIYSIPTNDVRSEIPTDFFAVFISGIFLRLLGAVIRLFLIFVGLSLSVITIVFFTSLFVAWIILPLILLVLLAFLFSLLIV